MMEAPTKTMNDALSKVVKRLHYLVVPTPEWAT